LEVSENNLSGNLDIEFPDSMLVLSAYSNNFVGTLPPSLAHCTQLQLLDLSKNELTGQLPGYLAALQGLRVLSVGYNKLHGSIPSNITNLIKLQVLDLSNNRISGKIPSNLERLQGFKTIGSSELSGNILYEDLEIVIKGFEYTLTYVLATNTILDLSSNNLIGEIPPSIGNLSSLRLLNLSSNQLEGNIPASLGDISTLEQLDLAKNDLSGEIPQELSMLSMLAYLDVSSNKLCGRIPLGTQFDTFNTTSFQGNRCLCGFPLQACNEKENQTQNSTGAGVNQGWLAHLDKYISLNAVGIGMGIGFAGTITVMILWKKARNWVMPPITKNPFYGMYKFPK